jgi:hypothetical protein
MKNPKNLLVQYKGGGYDGCFWEWNFFLFDEAGKFHDIGSSGRRAIKTEEKALDLLAGVEQEFSWSGPEFYRYDLTDPEALKEFQAETAASLVAGVVGKVNELYGRDVMYWECDECGNKQHDSEMFHSGYHGNGGIGVTMDGQLCMDCYSSGSCGQCGEYYGSSELDNEGHCQYCAEQLSESATTQGQK